MEDAYKLYLGGAAFWLGLILMTISDMSMQKLVGVECRLFGENKWELKFKIDLFFKVFAVLNSKYSDGM